MTDTRYECWDMADIPADDAELREGYFDGRAGEPEPGANRAPAYHHGWWAGHADRNPNNRAPWLAVLARQIVAASRAKTP